MSESGKTVKNKEQEKLTIDEAFMQIDEIMEKLSDDSVPLEDSIKLYKDGMDKLNECRKIIEEVEGKLTELGEEYASGSN